MTVPIQPSGQYCSGSPSKRLKNALAKGISLSSPQVGAQAMCCWRWLLIMIEKTVPGKSHRESGSALTRRVHVGECGRQRRQRGLCIDCITCLSLFVDDTLPYIARVLLRQGSPLLMSWLVGDHLPFHYQSEVFCEEFTVQQF